MTGSLDKSFEGAPETAIVDRSAEPGVANSKVSSFFAGTQDKCVACNKKVYPLEKVAVDGTSYHRVCFKCSHGGCVISSSNYVATSISSTAGIIILSSSSRKATSANLTSMNMVKRKMEQQPKWIPEKFHICEIRDFRLGKFGFLSQSRKQLLKPETLEILRRLFIYNKFEGNFAGVILIGIRYFKRELCWLGKISDYLENSCHCAQLFIWVKACPMVIRSYEFGPPISYTGAHDMSLGEP